MREKGSCSRKAFKKLPTTTKQQVCRKLRWFGRMTVHEFRVTGELRPRKFQQFEAPKNLSEDIADQTWQYFNLTNRIRVVGLLIEREFWVHAIQPDHDLK
jgi:hypothetical protein